jgi:hypothetical protein
MYLREVNIKSDDFLSRTSLIKMIQIYTLELKQNVHAWKLLSSFIKLLLIIDNHIRFDSETVYLCLLPRRCVAYVHQGDHVYKHLDFCSKHGYN